MKKTNGIFAAACAGSASWLLATSAMAASFNIPGGTLAAALDAYSTQSGVQIAISSQAMQGVRSKGASGEMSPEQALSQILSGTGFTTRRAGDSIAIVRSSAAEHSENVYEGVPNFTLAQAAPNRAAVETVTVTSSKLGGADVQSIPIAITALSQEQLTATQTAGGPDLVKQVPNLTFTKTNFTGYSIQIRGIGTQAISVTTDPAVAVAMNDVPFIRNHFFEQEFYDVGQLEVLRGPQGTLYGRNATAGVVNITTAKPTDQFEAMASGEIGNYSQRRFEGMINLPIVDDRLGIRFAGEWTKRQGYSFNELTDNRIDGRDLWSGRVTIGLKPIQNMQMYLVWEHFSESDDRMRTSKQLCKTDVTPTEILGNPVQEVSSVYSVAHYIGQGCLPESLYSPQSFEVPNGYNLPYYGATSGLGNPVFPELNPYASTTQSPNLHVISTTLDPVYKAKNDIVELNTDYNVTPELTLTSQTAFNHDFLWSTEDYNRFDTQPGVFGPDRFGANLSHAIVPDGNYLCSDGTLSIGTTCPGGGGQRTGYFCDPQLGCSNRLVAEDLSEARSWQLSQEFRIASKFSGPLNFSFGGNYLHYETEENYYVFINSLSLFAAKGNQPAHGDPLNQPGLDYIPGVTDNHECMPYGLQPGDPKQGASVYGIANCIYMDPNPITSLNAKGHNYFLSQNPYVLNSYAAFGEVYYDIFKNLKVIGGLRWTEDRKHAPQIPSWLLAASTYGYPVAGNVNQRWDEVTGRAAVNWTPQLAFTDQTLVYGSYAHGYKAGGANPPPAVVTEGQFYPTLEQVASVVHPLTFKPEFIDAFELGTKNTLFDGALTLNGTTFYYNYQGYQISEIVDRTSVNLNFNANVKGAELEAVWEPIPGLRFNFGGGYEDARLARGSKAIDLMDRTAGHTDWMVAKPFPTRPSNCILPVEYVAQFATGSGLIGLCPTVGTWDDHIDFGNGYFSDDPAINLGEGFYKDIGHNMMPNAPPFTASLGAQYSTPLSAEWAGTLRADGYWQDNSYWRVFNDMEYDKLHGYATLNLTLILTNQAGWQVMLYDKNVLNTTAITGAFLNSDDSGLTTNVFLTDPKLIGIRVTKNW